MQVQITARGQLTPATMHQTKAEDKILQGKKKKEKEPIYLRVWKIKKQETDVVEILGEIRLLERRHMSQVQ